MMNYFLLFFLIFGVLSRTWSDDLTEDNGETLALIPTEENESDADDEVTKQELLPLTLSGLYDYAKDISHLKGIYQEIIDEASGKRTLRRSIARKILVAFDSFTTEEILQLFDSKDDLKTERLEQLENLIHEASGKRTRRRSFSSKISIGSKSYTMEEILQLFDSKDDLKIELLEQLENLIHEYDVAVNFANMGGVKIMKPYLFSPNDKLACATALVLGSAMQSNPTVKKVAMKEDIGKSLLELLSHKSSDVLSRIIYALSCFLRNNPEAQEEFLSSEGFSKLADVLIESYAITDVKLKIISLFSDLAVEQETLEEDNKEGNIEKVSALQRSFSNEIEKNEICLHVAFFLTFEDYDTHQKTVAAMLSLDKICHKDFLRLKVVARLEKLHKMYEPSVFPYRELVYPNLDGDLKISLYKDIDALIVKFKNNSTLSHALSLLKVEL